MACGDYLGYWMNGIYYPYYSATYPVTVYNVPATIAQTWQCPGCKTYYSPAITCCTCAKDAEEPAE